ncbi:MAG: YtxH domain-containing protein [Actinomycetota bacterium]|nr:YtxH domain-containing protein [Actinomycetota bacterium]
MGFKTGALVGLGIGYILGTKAGRERYDELRRSWDNFMGNPQIQQMIDRGKDVVESAQDKSLRVVQEGVEKASGTVKEKLEGGKQGAGNQKGASPPA